jgi:type VI secretion system protein ImpG
MQDRLEIRYNDELAFIRRMAREFAQDRPKIAERLDIDRESGESQDPHVERMIEAFAFLTARIRLKLDDEFPELTEALLNTLYPHYLAPIPSMSVVQFQPDLEQQQLTTGFSIPAQSPLFTKEVDGIPCRFRTAYPVTLWPIELTDASFRTAPFGADVRPPARSANAPAAIRLQLKASSNTSLEELKINQLRFYLSGEESTVYTLYELLFNHATDILVRPAGASDSAGFVLPVKHIHPVGFGRDEGLLPYGHQSFLGYRLLTEYFTFPQKFLFFDLSGLAGTASADFSEGCEIFVFLNQSGANLTGRVSTETFRLGCTPIVNLFSLDAEPIRLTQTRPDYQVIPIVRHPNAVEVYSIDEVQSTNSETGNTTVYQPFFSFKHGDEHRKQTAYWVASRSPSVRRGDHGSEVFLSFVDFDFNPRLPAVDVAMLKVTCTNRDLPKELRFEGGKEWGFQLELQAPVVQVLPLIKPTAPCRLPVDPQDNRYQTRWRLISHLMLNHLSLVDEEDGAEAFRDLLKLYDFSRSKTTERHISGLARVTSRRCLAPVRDGLQQGFCRGVEVTIEFDEDHFSGSGVLLFASVLERFLGWYTTMNSATRLIARLGQSGTELKRWPFRAGDRILL